MGVVTPQALGASSLDDFEAKLLGTARALGGAGGGEDRVVCSLTRGTLRDADGYEWDRAGRSDCRAWRFRRGETFTSVSLLRYHGGKVGPWSPQSTPARLPSHNQWNLYFESDDGASHYFLYSALIHDPTQKLRRYVLRELLLMMNWRIVTMPSGLTPLSTHVMAATLRLRRLAPLTLLALVAASIAIGCLAYRRVFKYKVA